MDRIEIIRPSNARKIRIELVVVLRTGHLLDDDRHLLFLEPVGCHPDVILSAFVKCRCIHAFDRVKQFLQPDAGIRVIIRDHVGFVDTRERVVLRILQEARRPDGQRLVGDLEELRQFFEDLHRKFLCFEEPSRDLRIVRCVKRVIPQAVLVDELVEDIRCDHDGRGDKYLNAVEPVPHFVIADKHVDETKAAGFSSERAGADACETACGIERLLCEIGDDALLSKPPVIVER